MNQELPIRIILESPPAGVDFGIQKGSGNIYETILKQRSNKNDLCLEFRISVKEGKNGLQISQALMFTVHQTNGSFMLTLELLQVKSTRFGLDD